MKRQEANREKERGFTLVEMLIATVVVLFGLVAVAQLVPTSVMLNSNNRNDSTALAFAQREMEMMRSQSLAMTMTPTPNPPGFQDPQGVTCYPAGQTCSLGDPTQPGLVVGCPVVPYNGGSVIDYSAPAASSCAPGYFFTYNDPNDPFNSTYDVRWAVITKVNLNVPQMVTSRRIILGVFRTGMQSPTLPITLDVQVEK
jgi:prepilin-type N-terminal cleavage/methylation domain-containing protein